MADELFQTGEEFIIRSAGQDSSLTPDSDLQLVLYNQSTDNLEDGSTVEDLTSEPDGTDYSRQTVALDSADITYELNGDGNFQKVFADKTFVVEDATTSVDAYAVIVTYESQVADSTDNEEQLYFAAFLDQTYDLSNVDEFTLRGTGIAID